MREKGGGAIARGPRDIDVHPMFERKREPAIATRFQLLHLLRLSLGAFFPGDSPVEMVVVSPFGNLVPKITSETA